MQNIDSQLDELESMKGDLPKIVAQLEENFQNIKDKHSNLRSDVTKMKIDRDKADVDAITHSEKIDKLKDQQYKVRSNKEYDALTKEIAHAEASIEKFEKQMQELEGHIKVSHEDIETFDQQISEIEQVLKEKRLELKEVSEMNEDEELKLQHERDKIIVRIERADLAMYDRIRKAKAGLAVVSVRKNSCGGCHNRVPPQRLLELRQHKNIYKCENCGRILVSDEIVSTAVIPT